MLQIRTYFIASFMTALGAPLLLAGCSQPAPEHGEAISEAPAPLRAGPALTDAALAGMYMARDGKTEDGTKFVACLDSFVEKFDRDAEVNRIFNEISEETGDPLNLQDVSYFAELPQPERFKQLVDKMSVINAKTENDIFNFDSSSTCVLSPEDCALPAEDATAVRLYWTTIEHGSMSCYE